MELILNGSSYNYPETGTEKGWGKEAAGWAEEANTVLNSLFPAGSKVETQFDIPDQTAGLLGEAVPGLTFSEIVTQYTVLSYTIYRKSTTTTHFESGELVIYHNPNTPSTWSITKTIKAGSPSTVSLNMNGATVYMDAPVLSGTYDSGYMKFKTITHLAPKDA